MNAITLWQPHASLISDGPKRIETRTHNRFRGLLGSRIAIHAASRKVPYAEAAMICEDLQMLGLWDLLRTPAWLQRQPLGAIVCTAHVSMFGRLTDAEHAKAAACHITDNVFGLFLTDVRRLAKAIRCKGARGIWTVRDELIPETAR